MSAVLNNEFEAAEIPTSTPVYVAAGVARKRQAAAKPVGQVKHEKIRIVGQNGKLPTAKNRLIRG